MADEKPKSEEKPKKPKGGGEKQEKGKTPQAAAPKKGEKADVIIVDLDKAHLVPLYNAYSHLVYALNGSDVETVIINGRMVMHNREILTIDEKEIIRKVRVLAARIEEENRK